MGVDDANEGQKPGECPGHVWNFGFESIRFVGTQIRVECVCARCGAITLSSADDLWRSEGIR